jgi:adenylate cyclase
VSVSLLDISRCFQGAIPSAFATCSADGTPNVTYMSIVHLVDAERVALSRQFFNQSRANLDANPQAQVRVVDPETGDEYRLDLVYLHTETEGAVFEALRAGLDAVARSTGMGDVFRLRGADVYRVVRCTPVRAPVTSGPRRGTDSLAALDELGRRLAATDDYDSATRAALQALEDLFGFSHSILLATDGNRLLAVASNGYDQSGAGAEVAADAGVVGVATERGQVVCIANLARGRIMSAAVTAADGVGLPDLAGAASVAAVPLVARGTLLGVLYLESATVGTYGPGNERLLRVVGRQIAATLALLEADDLEEPAPPPAEIVLAGAPLELTRYQADDTILAAGEYVIRGAAGRILWRMLSDFLEHGRVAFTNRELRLDERLGLPAGADNLEARLLVLRKRLAAADLGIELVRVGRGRLELRVTRALTLTEVATSGPMRDAFGRKEHSRSS